MFSASSYPLVSVIVPTFNYADFISTALDSVLSQSYKNIEILVIDDGSTDDTRSKVEQNYKGLVRYYHQGNRGLSAARNVGLSLAQGEFIQFLDSDDHLHPKCIERKVKELLNSPTLGYVFGSTKFSFSERNQFLNLVKSSSQGWPTPYKNTEYSSFYFRNIAPVHAFLIRKSSIEAINLRFNVSLKACEDYHFWFRLLQKAGAPKKVRGSLAYYRKHSGSMSKNLRNQLAYDIYMFNYIYENFFQSRSKTPIDQTGENCLALLANCMLLRKKAHDLGEENLIRTLNRNIGSLIDALRDANGVKVSPPLPSRYSDYIRRLLLVDIHMNHTLSREQAYQIRSIFPSINSQAIFWVVGLFDRNSSLEDLTSIIYSDFRYLFLYIRSIIRF
jgi:glycosyltransferase involved in cell wall biosynthesis